MTKKTLILIRKPPFGSVDSWEGFRCSLSFYTSNLEVNVLLEGPGVFNWVRDITPETKDPHSVSRLAKDLVNFEIPVFIVDEDLAENGLAESDLVSSHPKIITRIGAAAMIASHDTTIAV